MGVVHAIKGVGAYAKMFREARLKHFADAAVRAKHVKGHTTVADARSWCNRWADKEAKRHMRAQRGNE